jgi:hypothetical protein
MEEILTLAEIEARYPSEWVLIADQEVNAQLEIICGRVVFHSKDRDEMYRKDMELRPKSAATFYAGTVPENTAGIL